MCVITCGYSSRRAGLGCPHTQPAASPKETDSCRRPWGRTFLRMPLQQSQAVGLAHPPGRGDPCPSPPSASAHVELQDGALGPAEDAGGDSRQRDQRSPWSQACPPGSQPGTRSAQGTPSVSCPSESLLGQVVGRTPGDCSPCPDGRGGWHPGDLLALLDSSHHLQGPTEPWQEGPRPGGPVHLPGQCSFLQEGGASRWVWADPRGGRPL